MDASTMSDAPKSDDGPTYKVNVLDRAIRVLQAFTAQRSSLTLAEVSRATGLHRSTALRLLSTLTHHGMVIRDHHTGAYALGYELVAMAETARAGSGLTDWARPVMKDMSDRLNETVVLSVRSGDFRVDIDQIVANQPIRRVVALGEHKLLTFGAPSLSIMSGLPEDEARAIFESLRARTFDTYPEFDETKFWTRLQAIRDNGYHEQTTQFGQGTWAGSVGIAGPIYGRRGEVVGSLGVSVPTARWTDDLREQVVAEVREGCDAIAARMGRRDAVA